MMIGKHGNSIQLPESLLMLSAFKVELIANKFSPWIKITLDQGAKLNALDLEFFSQLKTVIEIIEHEKLGGLYITSKFEKAFCAGGDVKSLLSSIQQFGERGARQFFEAEYIVDCLLYKLSVPYVALTPGICFGGGMGLTQSASLKIGLSNTVFSMPEVFIGLFADVGANKFLQHLPLSLRRFLVHTGARLNAQECLNFGLMDDLLRPGTSLEQADRHITNWITNSSSALTKSNLKDEWISQTVAKKEDSFDEAEIQFLKNDELDWELLVKTAFKDPWLASKTPDFSQVCKLSILVQHQLFKEENLTVEQMFDRELKLAIAMSVRPEFLQGVQAKLIDKKPAPALFQEAHSIPQNLVEILSE